MRGSGHIRRIWVAASSGLAESQIDSGSVHDAERYTGRHAEWHVGLGGNTAGQEECQGGDKQEKSLHNQRFILQEGKAPSYAIYAK